jgi:hypothetical protein
MMTDDREDNPRFGHPTQFPEDDPSAVARIAQVIRQFKVDDEGEEGIGIFIYSNYADGRHEIYVMMCSEDDYHEEMSSGAVAGTFLTADPINRGYGPNLLAANCYEQMQEEWHDSEEANRESNPSGHSTGMMVGVGIGAFIVGSMVTAASYNSVVVGPLFRRIQELEKKPPTP